MVRFNLLYAILVASCTVLAGCGSSQANSSNVASHASDASVPNQTDGGASLLPASDGSGGGSLLGASDGSALQGPLDIAPLTPELTVVTGAPVPTETFTATIGGAPAIGAAWAIDRGELGSINSTGTFTPSGTVGGVGTVSATLDGQTASTTITINIQSADQGDPSWTAAPVDAGAGGYGGVGGNGPGAAPTAAQTSVLNGTPTTDSAVSILYPYDGTVWPQGLLAPLLQWNPGVHAFDSVYVHIQEANFEYKGYFASNTTGPFVNVPIPQAAWTTMAYSNGGEPVSISLTFAESGAVYGPYTETWTIAQATLQGTIYYNSYGTALVRNSDSVDSYGLQYGAGTLAINPGATAPTLVAGVQSLGANGNGVGCRVCHTVAANGQSLVTQASNADALDYTQTVAINLANDTTAGAGTPLATPNLAFPALYKDGSLILSQGGLTYEGFTGGATHLYTGTGNPVTGVTGLPTNFRAALPSFSPDGAHVSFNFWAGTTTGDGGARLTGDQASLAMLDFNGSNAFSNPRVLYTPATGTAVTYSSFFPNSAGVVFEVELSNPSGNYGYTWKGNTGELWWIDVATGIPHRLDALNGYNSTGGIYLPAQPPPPDGSPAPHTPAIDVTANYEATVNPIASGGYAWVVFTSRRMYGNVAQIDPWTSDPRLYPWLDQITDKKMWVAAIDMNGKPGTDPSHPAFYLPGQELHAGNSRGYWTVEPCRANGQACVTGDQCCGGFCQPAADGGGLQCTAVAPPCAGQFEKCVTASDCCNASAGIQCINGVCTQPGPK
jgi:hypothetical protein